MSRLDELPHDQRAALSLLLRQRKSYRELATMLGISERAVHDRAHAALAMLAPRQARELTAEHRAEIGDYLLGQQAGVAERLATRTHLTSSEPARAWARELSAELAPLASAPLPEIPPAAAVSAPRPLDSGAQPSVSRANSLSDLASSSPSSPDGPPTSRLGGAMLLAAIVAAVVVAVVLLSGGGSSHKKSAPAKTSTSASAKTTTGPTIDQRLTLKSPNPASRSLAVVAILSEAGKRAFYIAAENLPPSKGFYYAIWLYNSPTSSEALSKSPAVGSNKRLTGGALLPANSVEYHEMLLTRETASKPTHPGHVVLRGAFSLGG
jgi:hypothetical protein